MLKTEIIKRHTKEYKTIKELYAESFPPCERMPYRYLSENDRQSDCIAFYDGDEFCGFFTLLNYKDITHVTFLAVEDDKRDAGYGSKALDLIKKMKPHHRILVDIEVIDPNAPNNDQRIKRKKFYLRNGYKPSGIIDLWQGALYEILISGGEISRAEFDEFWANIK